MQYKGKSATQAKDYMKSLRKALSVLKCFKPDNPEMHSAELGRIVGIHNSTAHRIVVVLMEEQFLERNERTRKYRIGPAMYSLGSLYLESTDILKIADPVTRTLNELTGEAIVMGIFDKGNVVVVIKEESKYTFRFSMHVGTVIPAFASSIGLAYLSELSEVELDRLYPDERLENVGKNTIKTKTELKEELETIRQSGYSIGINKGFYEGVGSAASLIRDRNGKVVAGISIAMPAFKAAQSIIKKYAHLVTLGCKLVNYRFGYIDPINPVHDIDEIYSWWEQYKHVD